MAATRIMRSLDFGTMMNVAYTMSRQEREAVASYLGVAENPTPAASAACADRNARISAKSKWVWNGWSPWIDNARFQPASAAGLTVDEIPKLRLKWAFVFDGDVSAFAQPTIFDTQLFTGSAGGLVYALDAHTGCVRWVYQANGPVRAAIRAVQHRGAYRLLFGDQTGWFYCLNASDGRLLWSKRLDEHDATRLTGAAVDYNGTVFVPVASWEETRASSPEYECCTFRGSILALRIDDGSVVWKTWTVDVPQVLGRTDAGTHRLGPSGAGIWSAPTLDAKRGVLYVTTGDNYSSPATLHSDAVLALDLKTGAIRWSRQLLAGDAFNSACGVKGPNCPAENGPDFDFAASAILARTGNRDLLIAGQKSGMVYALDPDRNGDVVWQTRVAKGAKLGGVQWGMAASEGKVYAAVSDVGLVRKASRAPTDVRAFEVDPGQGGGLAALRIADGNRVWFAEPNPCASGLRGCSPAQPAAVTAIPGAVFSGSMDGHIRAFSSETGALLWDYDTVREYDGVNGVRGRGGSLDGPGAVIVKGMVYVNSGYSRFAGIPGNVLLAFGTEGGLGK